jgi:prepilin-type N-terminal cleavage/methylation domain-containing protein
MFKKMQMDWVALSFGLWWWLLTLTLWACHFLLAPAFRLCHGLAAEPHPQGDALKLKFSNPKPRLREKFGMIKGAETNRHVTLNLGLMKIRLASASGFLSSAFSRHTFYPRPQSGVFRRGLNKPSDPRPIEPLNHSGFTLIELILVMVIIGILAATVLPRIDFGATSSRASVDGAAYMIASDIRYTQECAMANRVSKTIRFTANQSYYTFPATTPPTSGLDPSGQLASLKVTIGTTIDFTFNSLGEPTAGGGNFVRVSDGVNTRTITVTQYTGKVSIS